MSQLWTIKKYWKTYGGPKSFGRSIFVWIACGFALVAPTDKWAGFILQIFPSVLGFTLAGYAIIIGFSDRNFLAALSKVKIHRSSVFMDINAKFIHFILVQVVALIYSIIVTSIIHNVANIVSKILVFIGCWLLYYSILTALATALAIFALASIFEDYLD